MTAGVHGGTERPRGVHAVGRSGGGADGARAQNAQVSGTQADSVRAVLADVAAALVLLSVLPLALLQLPDAIAWAIPTRFAAAGPAAEISLLRVAGLAIVAMAVAAPAGGLAVRRYRAWPVLVAGLVVAAIADLLGGASASVVNVGLDRCLHGAGCGLALAAATALAAERRPLEPAARRSHGLLAGGWAGCAVIGLAAAPEVMRHRLAGGDWHAALRPYPWLTGIALGCAALYALLAQTPVPPGLRGDFSAAERSQLAVLAIPVVGISAVMVAVTFGPGKAVTAAAIAVSASLAGLAVMSARATSVGWFALMCATVGFTLAPAAGVLSDVLRVPPTDIVRPNDIMPGLAITGPVLYTSVAVIAAIGGAALALALSERSTGQVVAIGCLVAAAAFLVAGFPAAKTVLTGAHPRELAVIDLLVTGGLTAALTAAWRRLTPPGLAGAVSGVTLLLAGTLAGYLADGAMEMHALNAAATATQAKIAALQHAAGQWYLIAAMIIGCVALSTGLVLLTSGFSRAKNNETAGAPSAEPGRGGQE